MEIVLIVFGTIWFLSTIAITCYIAKDDRFLYSKHFLFILLREYVTKLFQNKNILGIFLSMIVFLYSVPAIMLIIILQMCFYLYGLTIFLWKIGSKNG